MTNIELLENMQKIIEMLCKNAAKASGIDFAILNDTGVEIHRRLIDLRKAEENEGEEGADQWWLSGEYAKMTENGMTLDMEKIFHEHKRRLHAKDWKTIEAVLEFIRRQCEASESMRDLIDIARSTGGHLEISNGRIIATTYEQK